MELLLYIVMNGTVIDVKISYTYGCYSVLWLKSEAIAFEEMICSAKSVLIAAWGIENNFAPMPPSILYKLYWSMCIPKLVYGFEDTNCDDDSLCLLETAHRINTKYIQNVVTTVPTPAPLATIGWLCIKSCIDIQWVMFLVRTCCLPDYNMYKQVIAFRLNCLRTNNEMHIEWSL